MSGAIYARFGVKRCINAAGPVTRLGGAPMAPEVLAAMADAAGASVDMAELQAAAGRAIASATGAASGMVTSGAAAALTLAAAACLAGGDKARMARLPDARGMPNRVLMPRTHRTQYARALSAAGAVLVDIGHNDRGTGAGVRGLEAWEIEAAIDAETVAFAFTATPETAPDLPRVAEICRRHRLPVIVDAAARLPPRSNLRAYLAAGADLVAFSGGKAIGGPQASGILAGRADLIESALMQQLDMDFREAGVARPHHGIGRGFKAGKEEIVGLLVALERFAAGDDAAAEGALVARLESIARRVPGRIVRTARTPMLELNVANADATIGRLAAGDPPIHLGEGRAAEGVLTVDLSAVRVEDDARLVEGLAKALKP
ncbi:MAG: aminotransferase class V-fold PLP-dependent enzyme [Alphaproteobacteria bacterium]|nr:aminotransferase class V-fold PLP-dependent enzyme [Alphaproteobacteria bacterium]